MYEGRATALMLRLRKLWANPWISNILWLLLMAAVYFGVRAYQQRDLAAGLAPVLEARSLDGRSIRLEDYRGRPALVYFWATWCTICKFGENGLKAVAKDYAVITIALRSGSDAEVRAYMQQNKIDFATINDPEGRIAERFGVIATPTIFFLDSMGRIHFREVGFTTETGLRARLWAVP